MRILPTLAFVAVLLATGASLRAGEEGDRPAPPAVGLHVAALTGDLEAVRGHIRAGTDLDAPDAFGSTPLAIAITFGRDDVARALIEGGADLEATNRERSTPLHLAVFFGRTAIVEALLAAGADRHTRNVHGSTPYDIAASPTALDAALYDELGRKLAPLGFRLDAESLRAARPKLATRLGARPEDLEGVDYAPAPRADWAVGTPAACGLDPRRVAELYLDASHLETLFALLVVKDGALVGEGYFRGGSIDRPELLNSVTKSVTSALVGLALERGHLEDLDRPFLDFFPAASRDVKDARKRDVTLRHLLAMRSGYPWEEEDPAWWKTVLAGDYRPAIAAFPLSRDPDTAFQYSNVSSHWLATIVAKASGRDLAAFAEEALFGPLGVQMGEWVRDPHGVPYGHAMLRLTARDAARFGQLYLDVGRWEGTPVVPAAWVETSLTRHSEDVTSAGVVAGRVGRYFEHVGYGYQWWAATVGAHDVRLAWGHGGQFVVLVDALDLVVVVLAEPFLAEIGAEPWRHERSNLNVVGKFLVSLPAH